MNTKEASITLKIFVFLHWTLWILGIIAIFQRDWKLFFIMFLIGLMFCFLGYKKNKKENYF